MLQICVSWNATYTEEYTSIAQYEEVSSLHASGIDSDWAISTLSRGPVQLVLKACEEVKCIEQISKEELGKWLWTSTVELEDKRNMTGCKGVCTCSEDMKSSIPGSCPCQLLNCKDCRLFIEAGSGFLLSLRPALISRYIMMCRPIITETKKRYRTHMYCLLCRLSLRTDNRQTLSEPWQQACTAWVKTKIIILPTIVCPGKSSSVSFHWGSRTQRIFPAEDSLNCWVIWGIHNLRSRGQRRHLVLRRILCEDENLTCKEGDPSITSHQDFKFETEWEGLNFTWLGMPSGVDAGSQHSHCNAQSTAKDS